MINIDIDGKKCQAPRECRKCMDVCSENVFWNRPQSPREPGKKAGNYMMVPVFRSHCTGCKLCEKACPEGAIKVTVAGQRVATQKTVVAGKPEIVKKRGPIPVAQLLDLTGKAAVVTGGGKGLGRAIASRLAEAGAAVMITDIDEGTANKAVEEIKAKGGKAQAIRADVTKQADADETVKATVKAFGGIDIMVNNAGIFPFRETLEIGEEIWDKMFDVNLKGVYFNSRAAAKEMINAGNGGRIINISSISAYHPEGNGYLTHYGVTKSAVINLTKAMAMDLAKYGILVNAVAPGLINTGGDISAAEADPKITKVAEEWVMKVLARVPLGRLGKPDDVAKVVLFLASSASDYMTGEVVKMDGGFFLS